MHIVSCTGVTQTLRRAGPHGLAGLILLAGWAVPGPSYSGGTESDLTEVVEEAKKPVEDQGYVERDYQDSDGGGFGAFLLGLFFDAGSSDCAESEETGTDPSPESQPWFDEYYLTFTSVHVSPNDGVLMSLTGGGLQVGAYLSPRVDAEVSASLLWGRVDPESPAYGALVRPIEGEVELRARLYASSGRILGLNVLVGVQYHHLRWDYANPVFAVEPDGYGLDVWDDWLGGVSWFCGVGVAPLSSASTALSLDVGLGHRTYLRETGAGFRNDLFADGSYSQANIKLTFRF